MVVDGRGLGAFDVFGICLLQVLVECLWHRSGCFAILLNRIGRRRGTILSLVDGSLILQPFEESLRLVWIRACRGDTYVNLAVEVSSERFISKVTRRLKVVGLLALT